MLSDLLYRLRALVRRGDVERELDDELRFHVERQTQKYVAQGLTPEDAARRGRLDFGGIDSVKEECRDARGVGALDEAARNLRYACRTLAKRPGFAVVAVVTLALGIGANSAVFSALHAVVLRPLPFPDADQLVVLQQYEPKAATPSSFVAPARLEDWQRMNSAFQGITGYYLDDLTETSGELPERISRAWVAPRFFRVFGVAPVIGRIFTADEERFGGPPAVIVSERFWQRRFGDQLHVPDPRLRIGQRSMPIVGVMPASFRFPNDNVDVWTTSPPDAPYARSRQSTWFAGIGRLRDGVTLAEGQTDLNAVQSNLGEQYPASDRALAVRVEPLKSVSIGGISGSLWMLFAAVSMLLIVACTNIAALLLARNAERRHEISIRYSLGASRASIVRQLLTEALVLAGMGSSVGLGVAVAAIEGFGRLAGGLPRMAEIRLDWTVVLYSFVCAAGSTLLFGLVPAIRITKQEGSDGLIHRSRTVMPATNRLQWTLVGIQVSLAVTLLVGAGLLVRSFELLARVSPGFDPSRVLTFRITGNWGETVDQAALHRRIESTLESLRAMPGVEAAATSVSVPGVPFHYDADLRVLEQPADPSRQIVASSRVVSSQYFQLLKIPVIAGETCADTRTPPTAVVNRSFATLYLPGLTPLGAHVEVVPPNVTMPAASIIGVVANAREQGLNEEPAPTIYWCNSAPVPTPLFLVRTQAVVPLALADAIRRKVHEIDPARAVYAVLPLEQHLNDTRAESRLRTVLLTAFALTAVSLAAVGLYGTLSYLVSIRRREIGVRMAMGALRRETVLLFLKQAVGVSLAGCAAGLWLAAALGRALSGMLYGVSPLDLTTFVAVPVLMLLVAALSSLWPALRAARVDPMQVLRDE